MQMSVSRSEALATSDDPSNTGPDADLIFSPIITFYITKGAQVSWNRATCSAASKPVETFSSKHDKEVCVWNPFQPQRRTGPGSILIAALGP